MNNVNCRGTELSVFQCDYQSLIGDYYPCGHSYDAGVYCSCELLYMCACFLSFSNDLSSQHHQSVPMAKFD